MQEPGVKYAIRSECLEPNCAWRLQKDDLLGVGAIPLPWARQLKLLAGKALALSVCLWAFVRGMALFGTEQGRSGPCISKVTTPALPASPPARCGCIHAWE